MSVVVEIKNLEKTYGSKENKYQALNNINLQINQGEFIGVMGPSGAGKSTLLNMIATIDTPTSGSLSIGNKNISNLNEDELSFFRRNNLGFIFQDFNLLDTLTLKENIILPLTLSKIKVSLIEEKVEEIAKSLGIEDILEKYPYETSGGQKQRAAAARAIITNPTMILADEPTGALDSKSSKDLLECLSNLNESKDATIMMVTHDAFAASYCKRIVFIKDGNLFIELLKGSLSRNEFYQKILEVLATIGNQ